MKKIFGIAGALLLANLQAHAALSGKPKPGGNSTVTSTKPASNETDHVGVDLPVTSNENISCGERDNRATYQFIQSISSQVEYKINGDTVEVSIPEYYSACIDDINLQSTVGPDNNVYIQFGIEPSSKMVGAKSEIEQNYEKCIKENYSNITSWDQADKEGLIKRNKFNKIINLANVSSFDKSRDSEVVIGSHDNVYSSSDNYNSPAFSEVMSSLPADSDQKWRCMRFESPAKETLMVNQTEATRLNQEAEQLCKSSDASLADIGALLEQMRLKDTGNLSAMIKVLEQVQRKLLKEEVEADTQRLTELEDNFQYDGEDGVISKSEAKKYSKEYEQIMEKFNKQILPAVEAELRVLFSKRDMAEDPEAIDERIKELNELVALYVRNESDNTGSFIAMKDTLKEHNLKGPAREIFKAVTSAKYYSQAYLGDEDERGKKISLVKAKERSKSAVKTVTKEMFARWDEEAALNRGDRAPIERRKKAMLSIRKKSQQDYRNFQTKNKQKAEYMNNYVNRMVQHYCGSGGDYKQCNYVRSQYAPKIAQMYQSSMQQENQKYQQYWQRKYQGKIDSQNSLIGRYENMYRDAQFNLEQQRFSDQRKNLGFDVGSDFDFWLSDSSYEPMDSFYNNMSFSPDMNMPSNIMPYSNDRMPANNQAPMFTNPYRR